VDLLLSAATGLFTAIRAEPGSIGFLPFMEMQGFAGARPGVTRESRLSTEAKVPQELRLNLGGGTTVTAIAYPAAAERPSSITLILAHGAGAPQTSAFMVRLAAALASRGNQTITFNFPYMEARRRIPDSNAQLEACYRTVIAKLREMSPYGALVIGGKSMGGRIATQIAASDSDGLSGLVVLGYPLHPPGRAGPLRDKHLGRIRIPMLFVQGSRDPFGRPEELLPVLEPLPARLRVVEDGDHSFKVPKRSGVSQERLYEAVMDDIDSWLRRTIPA
jgi:uncharacterized protein